MSDGRKLGAVSGQLLYLGSYLEDAGEGVAPLVEVLLVVGGGGIFSGVIVVVLVHSAPFIDPRVSPRAQDSRVGLLVDPLAVVVESVARPQNPGEGGRAT